MAKDINALLSELEPYRKSDPLRYLKDLAAAIDVTQPDFRFLRAEILHGLSTKLQSAARVCDFCDEIVVRPQGVFVNIGGVLMESSRTGIYLKASGSAQASQASQLARTLNRFEVDVRTIVDIGANFGEISLGLAREFPRARIVAVEPSADNATIFEINRTAQSFAVDRVELVRAAIADQPGTVMMTRGQGGMTRVVETGSQTATESVTCERLDGLLDRLGITDADFVKIDIEGGEPKLREAMLALGRRVHAYYIEFSQFAPLAEYLSLAAALTGLGFKCFDDAAQVELDSLPEIEHHLGRAFEAGPMAVTNLWFVRKSRQTAN